MEHRTTTAGRRIGVTAYRGKRQGSPRPKVQCKKRESRKWVALNAEDAKDAVINLKRRMGVTEKRREKQVGSWTLAKKHFVIPEVMLLAGLSGIHFIQQFL